MLFVVLILAAVLSSVLPSVNAYTVHIIINPFTLVLATIKPGVGSESLNLILLPFTIVPRAVVPTVNTFSVLLTGKVLAFIY